MRGMLQVVAACNACGRFLLAVQQSHLSGANPRCTPHRDPCTGHGLLVTDLSTITVNLTSAAPRQRRKSKTVHAQRPGQIPPRPFHASFRHSRGGGNPAKTKHATPTHNNVSPLPRWERARVRVKEARSVATAGDAPAHPVIPADSPPSFPPTPPSFPRRREPREKQSTPFANLVYPSMRIPPTRHHHPLPYNRNHYNPNFSPLNPTSHDNPNPNHQPRTPHPCHRRTFDGVSCVVRPVARRRVDQQRR